MTPTEELEKKCDAQEEQIKILKRFGHQFLAHGFMMSGHAYMTGHHHAPMVQESIDEIKKSADEYKAYIEQGVTPDWMLNDLSQATASGAKAQESK